MLNSDNCKIMYTFVIEDKSRCLYIPIWFNMLEHSQAVSFVFLN